MTIDSLQSIHNHPDVKSDKNNHLSTAHSHPYRPVIINVDDLGLSPAVNQAVIHLAERQRISASSYMTGGQITTQEQKVLNSLAIDIGLHFDLTGIFKSALTTPLKSLIIKSYLRQIDKQQVSLLIHQQLDEFEDTFQCIPAFIDGHQHVHQLPVIRHCLVDALVKRYGTQVAVRVTTPLMPIHYELKAWIIYILGGYAWRQLCQQQQLAHHDKFGGVYDFNASPTRLEKLWHDWLQHCPTISHPYNQQNPEHSTQKFKLAHTTVIMCHPAVPVNQAKGYQIADWQDEIKPARECEYEWLMSAEFKQLCRQYHIKLTRWTA